MKSNIFEEKFCNELNIFGHEIYPSSFGLDQVQGEIVKITLSHSR